VNLGLDIKGRKVQSKVSCSSPDFDTGPFTRRVIEPPYPLDRRLGPRTGLDALDEKTKFACPCWESNIGRLVLKPSLCLPSYNSVICSNGKAYRKKRGVDSAKACVTNGQTSCRIICGRFISETGV
jgi:hypothetical protein